MVNQNELEAQATETQPGYVATSILEKVVKEQIIANTHKGVYLGDLKYIDLYNSLTNYNLGKNEITNK